jgi:hypothetical protein
LAKNCEVQYARRERMCEKGGSSRTFWSFPFNAGVA